MKKLLESLKAEDRKKIQSAFDKAVNEEVAIRVAAITETVVNEMVEAITEKTAAEIDQLVENATEVYATEISEAVDSLNEQVGPYIDALVAKVLPEHIVERVATGLRFEKQLAKIQEALVEEAAEIAAESAQEEIDELQEQLRIAEEKYNSLFEQTVSEAVKQKTAKKQAMLERALSELPERDAKVVRKIFNESVDLQSVEASAIKEKVERMYETIRKTKKSASKLNEEDESKGQVVVETKKPEEDLDPEVGDVMQLMERFVAN